MDLYFTDIENFIMKIQLYEYPDEIQDKVLYLMQNGKRLRPILCMLFSGIKFSENDEIGEIGEIGENDENGENNKKIIYTIASSIEQIHCLSLVLDDMPEMDNDNLRRNLPSFHIKYGKEFTNLFIYYMFNSIGLSISNILDTTLKTLQYDYNIAIIINNIFTDNLNMLIDGQYIDLEWFNTMTINSGSSSSGVCFDSCFKDEIDIIFECIESVESVESVECINLNKENANELYIELYNNIELNMKKTSSLFNLSICSGFLLQIWINKLEMKKNESLLKKLKIWSNILGYMYQISDDLLDIDDDIAKGSPNVCQILDKEVVYKLLVKGCKWLNNMIQIYFLGVSEDGETVSDCVSINLNVINKIIEKILKRVKK